MSYAEPGKKKQSVGIGGSSNDRGFILVAVLAALAVLSALAVSFAIATRLQARMAANASLVSRLQVAADAGIFRGVLSLTRSNNPAAGPDWRQSCAFDDEITIGTIIEDEAGKVDLNYGDERLLAQLLLFAGVPEPDVTTHIDRIVDFRDTDDLKRPRGAEDAEYRASGLGYGPKNKEFATVDELEQVLLLPEVVVSKIKPFVTVHSKLLGIDPDVASPILLGALADATGPPSGSLAPSSPAQQLMLGRFAFPHELRARTHRVAFTITSVAEARNGGQFARRAIIELTPRATNLYRILQWDRLLDAAAPRPEQLTHVRCR